ncbi:N-acetyltransferase [Actinomadura logoneensis]|uniref:N-acetyltransferase n=1 Tax=Actinomadura logoneensis TaxID=2293572 RepID=A0A372JIC1_9ACTN|nr:GNAT family N-acetyltransferase [Actinomadura logoneensis]RFU39659.1 N-acetyltransferase [Actinomadura logoneensis]
MTKLVKDDRERNRYEITVDGALAGFAEYHLRKDGRTVVFTHTEIFPEFGGQGVGGALARGALDDVRAGGRTVVPLCPFIKGWIDKHPDYQDLVVRPA